MGYVGTKATHLKTEYDQNAPIYDPNLTLSQNRANIDDRRPVKDFQTISRWMHGLNSSYHALQVSVDKRYSHGFTISTSYTWSKNLDYVSRNGFGGSRGINNPFNFFFSRGNSDLTRTHRFVNSFVWDLPRYQKNSTVDAVLGNWRFSGITTLQSGRPFQHRRFEQSDGRRGIGARGPGRRRLSRAGSRPLQRREDCAVFRQDPFRQSCAEHLRHTRTERPVRTRDSPMSTPRWRRAGGLPFLGEGGMIEYRFEAFNLFQRYTPG